jgi:deoxyribodipyrimidine photo-lyase
MKQKINIFWFRRDLRLHDNTGLYHALNSNLPVLPVFIFDIEILEKLPINDARINFIYNNIQKLKTAVEKKGSSVKTFFCKPLEAFNRLCKEFTVEKVFTNKDYEPYATKRDSEIDGFLDSKGIQFLLFKDHVIFEENEVVKDDGNPYTVFTPYSKKWKSGIEKKMLAENPSDKDKYLKNLLKTNPFKFPELKELGFERSTRSFPESEIPETVISNYGETRNLPAVKGTSRLGVHLRFGTISIRRLTKVAQNLSEVFLNELIWRNFFIDILWHFPHVVENTFKPKYDFIDWRNNENEFKKWCNGETGFPLVDAGMRELNESGFMHNRVRMLTAGFLAKHLLIDWRWGEAYFAEKLLDFELASNNGNWQWAAGCGCDAAPYFRIFNPETQQKKFDPESKYILKWIPEYGTTGYPPPMVDHKFARERALRTYKEALQ